MGRKESNQTKLSNDLRSWLSNPQPLVYKASGLSTTPQQLLLIHLLYFLSYKTFQIRKIVIIFLSIQFKHVRKCSGSVVECLTWDRAVVGSGLTCVTALCPWERHINSCSVMVQSRKTRPDITVKSLTGTSRIKSNKQKFKHVFWVLKKTLLFRRF